MIPNLIAVRVPVVPGSAFSTTVRMPRTLACKPLPMLPAWTDSDPAAEAAEIAAMRRTARRLAALCRVYPAVPRQIQGDDPIWLPAPGLPRRTRRRSCWMSQPNPPLRNSHCSGTNAND